MLDLAGSLDETAAAICSGNAYDNSKFFDLQLLDSPWKCKRFSFCTKLLSLVWLYKVKENCKPWPRVPFLLAWLFKAHYIQAEQPLWSKYSFLIQVFTLTSLYLQLISVYLTFDYLHTWYIRKLGEMLHWLPSSQGLILYLGWLQHRCGGGRKNFPWAFLHLGNPRHWRQGLS